MMPTVWSDAAARRSESQELHHRAAACFGLAVSFLGDFFCNARKTFDDSATATLRDAQCVKSSRSEGFSLIGFLCTLIVLGCVVLCLIRIGPSVFEFWAIEKTVKAASSMSGTPAELRAAYDKLASVGYLDALQGKDLVIEGSGD